MRTSQKVFHTGSQLWPQETGAMISDSDVYYPIITGQGWLKAFFFFSSAPLERSACCSAVFLSRVCESHPSPRLQAVFKTLQDKACGHTTSWAKQNLCKTPRWVVVLSHRAERDFFFPPPNLVLYRFSFSSEGFPLLGCPKEQKVDMRRHRRSKDIMTRQSNQDKTSLNGTNLDAGCSSSRQFVHFSTLQLNINVLRT